MTTYNQPNISLGQGNPDRVPVCRVMLLAGETSGDGMAAGLVDALKEQTSAHCELECFGAGGERMKAAGVEILEDMTRHTVFGLSEVVRHYFHFKAIFQRLLDEVFERKPHLIILTDYAGFNLRFAKAIRKRLARLDNEDWSPRILYYVSPQVWASRASRVFTISQCVDCVLSLFPFEKPWYALRAPLLRVEFVGDPMADKYRKLFKVTEDASDPVPQVLLLPGSRRQELRRHVPIMAESIAKIHQVHPCRFLMVLANEEQLALTKSLLPEQHGIQLQIGGLSEALTQTALTLACSGTVTRECGYHGVPTVVFYKLSWLTYWIAKQIIKVKYIAMPNLLLNRLVYPELIQSQATPDLISEKALQFLQHPKIRQQSRHALQHLMDAMGEPGAFNRAARTVMEYLPIKTHSNPQ